MELSKELKEKAKKELGEKEEWRDRDVQALRERVQQNKGAASIISLPYRYSVALRAKSILIFYLHFASLQMHVYVSGSLDQSFIVTHTCDTHLFFSS